jgi:hypothetical protein
MKKVMILNYMGREKMKFVCLEYCNMTNGKEPSEKSKSNAEKMYYNK